MLAREGKKSTMKRPDVAIRNKSLENRKKE